MEISFLNPVYLWALILVPVLIVLYFFSLKYSKTTALKFANFIALSRVSGGVGESSHITLLVVRMFALVFIVLSISGMTLWYYGETSNKDYVLAIDASASMMSNDFSPTRLDSAKNAAISFVGSLPINSQVAVLSFSGTSFVDQPLTQDRSVVKDAIKSIQAKGVGGTDLGNAIITSSNLLIPSKKAKAIILLTDGRSNIGVSENTAIAYAIDNHITVSTIGIGSQNVEDKFDLGADEEALKNIAGLTLGNSYVVKTPEDLNNVYEQIIKNPSMGKNPIELSFILLIAALILLLFDWMMGSTIYRRII